MSLMLNIYHKIRRYFIKKKFPKYLGDEVAEEFLKFLLKSMDFYFLLDSELQKSIKDFRGVIQFRSKDNEIRVLAKFKKGRLKRKEIKPKKKLRDEPNATVIFENAEALMNFLLPRGGITGRRDILRSILNNEVILERNFNYIYRFGFLANHIQLDLQKLLQ